MYHTTTIRGTYEIQTCEIKVNWKQRKTSEYNILPYYDHITGN
jgi:hypothetical protein